MKKKLIVLSIILTLVITGCGNDSKKTDDKNSNVVTPTKAAVVEEKEDNKKEETKSSEDNNDVLVKFDEFETNVTLRDPDTLKNVYGDMTVTNNSKFPLTYFNLTVIRKSDNEKTYFISSDTVMPEETSPKFSTILSKDGGAGEYEIVKYEYKIKDGDKYFSITYDVKLNEYKVRERNK